jgi:hypothetical protein
MAASSTGQSEPKAITKVDIVVVRPKNRIATGITAEAGSGRKNSSIGERNSCAACELPIAAPSRIATTTATIQPAPSRCAVAPIVVHRLPDSARSTMTPNAFTGAATNRRLATPVATAACHSAMTKSVKTMAASTLYGRRVM